MNNNRNPERMCRTRFLDRISAYDFALIEMNLYLDTHPNDRHAMELVAAYRQKRAELIDAYESHFGTYVVTAADVEGDYWSWIDDPWPWDYVRRE